MSRGNIYVGARQTGKTFNIIKEAHEKNLYILCANDTRRRTIVRQADMLGMSVPHPLIPNDLPLRSHYIKHVVIDDIESVMQMLVGKPIHSYSIETSEKLFHQLIVNPEQEIEFLRDRESEIVQQIRELDEKKVSLAEEIRNNQKLMNEKLEQVHSKLPIGERVMGKKSDRKPEVRFK